MHTRHPLLLALVLMTGCSDCSDVRDPVADAECFATFEPCGPGNTQVSACAPGARCFAVERCGEQILCALVEPDMDAPEMSEPDMTPCTERPECAPDARQLARCADGASCAAPCPQGASCSRISACGETVICADACADLPLQCEQGAVLHDVTTPHPDGAIQHVCNSNRSVCGTPWECCRYRYACDPFEPPQCGVAEREVETCVGSPHRCVEQTRCGQTIFCEEIPRDCDVPPTCPSAPPTTQVQTCAPDHACFPVTQCGQTILCQLTDGCAPQLAEGVGSCGQLQGVRWNGIICESVSGCACVGSGCAALYATIPECEADRTQCASTL
jgi:hypothetical protein